MRKPLQLTLCLTNDCTLRCRYCYAGRKYAHAMSRETAERGMNSCGCSNYAGSGHFNQVSPFLCNLEQTLILLADHLVEQLYQERNESFIRLFSLPSR